MIRAFVLLAAVAGAAPSPASAAFFFEGLDRFRAEPRCVDPHVARPCPQAAVEAAAPATSRPPVPRPAVPRAPK